MTPVDCFGQAWCPINLPSGIPGLLLEDYLPGAARVKPIDFPIIFIAPFKPKLKQEHEIIFIHGNLFSSWKLRLKFSGD
jgi:hypothetical protein